MTPKQNKTKQNKTKQNKTKQNKTTKNKKQTKAKKTKRKRKTKTKTKNKTKKSAAELSRGKNGRSDFAIQRSPWQTSFPLWSTKKISPWVRVGRKLLRKASLTSRRLISNKQRWTNGRTPTSSKKISRNLFSSPNLILSLQRFEPFPRSPNFIFLWSKYLSGFIRCYLSKLFPPAFGLLVFSFFCVCPTLFLFELYFLNEAGTSTAILERQANPELFLSNQFPLPFLLQDFTGPE